MAQQSLYERVYQDLRSRILTGTLAVGERLPSQVELTTEFAVSAITVKRALDMLRSEGFVVRRPRIGTVVVSREPAQERRRAGMATIGYVVPGFDDAFGTRVLAGLLDAATDRAHVLVAASHGDPELEERLLEAQLERGVDGLVLLPSSSELIPPSVVTLVGRQFPLVILDRVLTGTPVSTVTSDNVGGGRAAAEHLFELGHEHLAIALSPNAVSTLEERRRGFVAAHAAHHVRLDPDVLYTDVRSTVPGSHTSPDDDVRRLGAFLTDHPEVTGVVAGEYHSARLVLRAAHQVGRRVPDDLSIICFDAPPEFVDAAIPMTHVEQDQHAMGHLAVDLVLRQREDADAVAKESVPVSIALGRSTGPVPAR